jgi:predicted DsbA family dithiol-disulfide isomerase
LSCSGLAEALFGAYFSGGRDLNDREELAAVASGVGLAPEEVRAYLDGGEGADEVWRSQEEASRLGIRGVPFYVVDGRYALAGAQPVEAFVRARRVGIGGAVGGASSGTRCIVHGGLGAGWAP